MILTIRPTCSSEYDVIGDQFAWSKLAIQILNWISPEYAYTVSCTVDDKNMVRVMDHVREQLDNLFRDKLAVPEIEKQKAWAAVVVLQIDQDKYCYIKRCKYQQANNKIKKKFPDVRQVFFQRHVPNADSIYRQLCASGLVNAKRNLFVCAGGLHPVVLKLRELCHADVNTQDCFQ